MHSLNERIDTVIQLQRDFFNSGLTLEYDFRMAQLERLEIMIKKNEKKICEALFLDLHKSANESFLTEIDMVLSEIRHVRKYLKYWMRPRPVAAQIATMPSRNRIVYEPYGIVLIIAPWNYPFQLLVNPLIGALAAGNTAILKPSPLSAHMSELMAKLFGEYFPERHIALFEGHSDVNQALLARKFDYIFFTGSVGFGKYVAMEAARQLTPVTLELGGKSPCIVGKEADCDLAARRIVWGKMLNAGQTCVAPDYLLVHESVKEKLIAEMKKYILEYFPSREAYETGFPRIINREAAERLEKLMHSDGRISAGGETDPDNRFIALTIIEGVSWESPVMQEEIFGPLLPVLTFSRIEDAIASVRNHEKPLALYYFGDKKEARTIAKHTSSGGMCVNDTIMHLANRHLPFGGVGKSGYGRYHGFFSFQTFSNPKALLISHPFIDIKFRYFPYQMPQWLKRFI